MTTNMNNAQHRLIDSNIKTLFIESIDDDNSFFSIRPCTLSREEIANPIRYGISEINLQSSLITSLDFMDQCMEHLTMHEFLMQFDIMFGLQIDFYIDSNNKIYDVLNGFQALEVYNNF